MLLAPSISRSNVRCLAAASLLLPALLASGCSSDGPSETFDQRIAQATMSMDVAATQEARRYAAAEIALAEERLAAARQANRMGEEYEADRLLAEAQVNLELAKAKAEAERVKAELRRMQAAADNRAGGDTERRAR